MFPIQNHSPGSFESQLLLPGETLSTFPLSSVTPIFGQNLPLSMLDLPYNSNALPAFSDTHLLLSGNVSLDQAELAGMSSPSVLRATLIITGDPLSPVRSYVDLSTPSQASSRLAGMIPEGAEASLVMHMLSLNLVLKTKQTVGFLVG